DRATHPARSSSVSDDTPYGRARIAATDSEYLCAKAKEVRSGVIGNDVASCRARRREAADVHDSIGPGTQARGTSCGGACEKDRAPVLSKNANIAISRRRVALKADHASSSPGNEGLYRSQVI